MTTTDAEFEAKKLAEGIVPDVGLHRDVDDETYHNKWKRAICSNSRLSLMKRSAKHCWYDMVYGLWEPTVAKELGSAFHCRVLQPDKFDETVLVGPTLGRDTVKCVAFAAQHPGKIVVNERTIETAKYLADEVMKDKTARFLIESAAALELSGVWDEADAGGLRCKARLDIDCPEASTIADLKKTRDASPEKFTKAIFEYGYYRQADTYLGGMESLSKARDHFVFIAIEEAPPHCVACYRIKDDVLTRAREEKIALMRQYQKCCDTGYWPGYGEGIQEIGIPAWGWDRMTDLVERV